MNNSDGALGEVVRFFQLPGSGIVVLYDESDLGAGQGAGEQGGGHAGTTASGAFTPISARTTGA